MRDEEMRHEGDPDMLNRRQVVGGLVSLAAFGARGWTAYAAPRKQSVRLDGPLSRSVFRALKGDKFMLSTGDGTVSIHLIRIDEGPQSTETDQFTLVFLGPHDPVLPDGPHQVTHPTAGTTTLFLQPREQNHLHTYYEAPFNLLL
jgi:uncharacterized protein DUF6916